MTLAAVGAQPAPAVVGGTPIRIQSAPWVVLVRQVVTSPKVGQAVEICSGAVVDSTHVLTAAHCVFDLNGARARTSALSIVAGVSNVFRPRAGDVPQERPVSAVRVDSGYGRSHTVADDVAMLTFSSPLDLAGRTVRAAVLPRGGGSFPAGAPVELAGFGRESPSAQPNGTLNELRLTVDPRGTCGTNHSTTVMRRYSAIALCASSTAGSICLGDSGAALVRAGTRTIVGIASGGPEACAAGNHSIYAFAATPEIAAFIRAGR